MEIKHKIWLEKDGRVIFGKGRDELLKTIDECRSLNAAARKLNMSYRAAWGRLRASEERMGVKLVETDRSGKGMRLTENARRLMAMFDKTDRKISRLLQKAYEELQPHTTVKPR
jgi:molybdate transport system regulatory protein